MTINAKNVRVIRCSTLEELNQCYEIRYEVFSDEQGYSRDLEVDEYDKDAMHFLAIDGVNPIGTVRLVYPPISDEYKLGRLAVRKAGRGRGIAQLLVAELEKAARDRGADVVYAGAQVPVRPFYEKRGYVSTGQEYLDEGQPHIMMVKDLISAEA